MTSSESNDTRPGFVADDELCDDNGDLIGTRASVIADGLHSSAGDRIEDALALMSHHEFARILANRVSIEEAKGMLMLIYGIDADEAFELLKWRSQTAGVGVGEIAERLCLDLVHAPRPEQADLRSWCDHLLVTVHDRIVRAGDALAVTAVDAQPPHGTSG